MPPDENKFGKWYQGNRGKLRLSRKQRYHTDPVYRAEQIDRARQYRASFTHRAPDDPFIIEVEGLPRICWRIGQVCKKLGCPDTQLRTWERRKLIPPCTIESTIRMYTSEQVDLLQAMWTQLLKFRKAPKGVLRVKPRLAFEAASKRAIRKWRK